MPWELIVVDALVLGVVIGWWWWRMAYCCRKVQELYEWAIPFYTDYKERMKKCCNTGGDPTFPPVEDPKWP